LPSSTRVLSRLEIISSIYFSTNAAPNGWRYRRLGESTDETEQTARHDSPFVAGPTSRPVHALLGGNLSYSR